MREDDRTSIGQGADDVERPGSTTVPGRSDEEERDRIAWNLPVAREDVAPAGSAPVALPSAGRPT